MKNIKTPVPAKRWLKSIGATIARVVSNAKFVRKLQQERSIKDIRRWLIDSGETIKQCREIRNRWHVGDYCVSEKGLREYYFTRNVECELGRATSRACSRVDATANRVDRLRLCGNGVVPQCAEKAFRVLTKRFWG